MGNRHMYLQNLNGDPSLITSMNGGNFAINGNANVSFNVANGGSQGINANQGVAAPITVQPVYIRQAAPTIKVVQPVQTTTVVKREVVEQPRIQPRQPSYMDEANRAMRDAREQGYLLI